MKAADFVGMLFLARDVVHSVHLNTRSYAKHKALQKFYSELPDLVDSVIEAWQGRHQELVQYPDQMVELSAHDDALEYVMFLKILVEEDRYVLGEDSEIQNLVDDVAQLIDSTIYKLTFLK